MQTKQHLNSGKSVHSASGLLILLVAICLVACRGEKHTKDHGMKFRTLEVKSSGHLKNDEKFPLLSMELKLVFPDKFHNKTTLEKVRHLMLADFFPDINDTVTSPENAMQAYIKAKKHLYETSEDLTQDDDLNGTANGKVTWWDKTCLLLRYNTYDLLSYTVESSQYTGGAHGGTIFRNSLIDLKTGEKLTEEDLFTENSLPLINDIILKKLEDQNKVETQEDLEQIGYFDVSQIGQYKNFYLTGDGIVYTFNEYEIGAYALGTIEVKLSFKDIEGFLSPDSPLERIIR